MSRYYDFFLSFSSIDWRRGQKDDIEAFFDLLVAKLARLGLTDGGYFAPDEMHRGAAWEAELEANLARSRVLVPLYSPNYFKSVYCGKEWQVFRERFDENRRSAASMPRRSWSLSCGPPTCCAFPPTSSRSTSRRARTPRSTSSAD